MSHQQEQNMFKIAFNLTGACLISAVIIAVVYFLTHDTAVRKEQELRDSSMRQLVKTATRFEEIKDHKGWFKAYEGDKFAAYIIPGESKGYGGTIKMIFAISPNDIVINYTILDSKETPGLGDKAGISPFRDSLIGKDIEHMEVTKDPADKSHVLAITGATITSRAVTKGAREAEEEVKTLIAKGK